MAGGGHAVNSKQEHFGGLEARKFHGTSIDGLFP